MNKPLASKLRKTLELQSVVTEAAMGPAATMFVRQVPAAPKTARESLSLPMQEYEQIAVLRDLAQEGQGKGKAPVTRSQVLRAGLLALSAMPANELHKLVDQVRRQKPGRKTQADLANALATRGITKAK